jgi:ecotin
MKPFYLLCSFLLFSTLLNAAQPSQEKYHMFPQAKEGQERYIIEVPKMEHEENYKVQLLIGKEMLTDCNTRRLFGKVEKKTVQGWGYHYYVVSDINEGIHTMMVCKEQKEERFVPLVYPDLLRYNSRLGTVVYVPKGYEVRYRIWHAENMLKEAEQK